MTLTESIKAKIDAKADQSFAELAQAWPEHFGPKAEAQRALVMPGYETIIIWPWLSKEGLKALRTLQKDRDYTLAPTPLLVYLADGMVVDLPIAKRLHKYKKDRWLPCIIRKRKPKEKLDFDKAKKVREENEPAP